MFNIEQRIKHTKEGFNYIKVSPIEIINWGGACICNSCGKQYIEDMYFIFVLTDTYCEKCFNDWCNRNKNLTQEDIEYDLKIQKEMSHKWYNYHLGLNENK